MHRVITRRLGLRRAEDIFKASDYSLDQMKKDSSTMIAKCWQALSEPSVAGDTEKLQRILLPGIADTYAKGIQNLSREKMHARITMPPNPKIQVEQFHFIYGPSPAPPGYKTHTWANLFSLVVPSSTDVKGGDHRALMDAARAEGCILHAKCKIATPVLFEIVNETSAICEDVREGVRVDLASNHFRLGSGEAIVWKIMDIDSVEYKPEFPSLTSIQRGHPISNPKRSVIFKGSAISSNDENQKLLREYEILQLIHEDSGNVSLSKQQNLLAETQRIAKPIDLIWAHGSYVLVLEDFGGISLRDLLFARRAAVEGQMQGLEFEECLDIGLQLAEAMQIVHSARIIHKDVNPDNVITRIGLSGRLQVQLIDFRTAEVLQFCQADFAETRRLEFQGTLPYLAPEQTGRIERVPDHRSDLYSLGITLWELFIGEPPFKCRDAMEYVHCHLAREVEPLHLVNPRIPEILSKMVSKLVSKSPEERYQSASGLRADFLALKSLIQQFKSDKGLIQDVYLQNNLLQEAFVGFTYDIGCKDFSHSIIIPRGKLYGKQNQNDIMNYFDLILSGHAYCKILIVEGPHGSGKNLLIEKTKMDIVKQSGRFSKFIFLVPVSHSFEVQGKFRDHESSKRISGILEAISDLLKQFLSGSNEELEQLKQRLLEKLKHSDLSRLNSIIPELALLFPDLENVDSTNLGCFMTEDLTDAIIALSSPKQPVVMFLDNVQV
ncbi:hypothetical protein HDU67_002639 [Dinochytrium kinnereticum]|nr:hypothetical protein HDU67_002639 [Dinochytrium kinnereticum]